MALLHDSPAGTINYLRYIFFLWCPDRQWNAEEHSEEQIHHCELMPLTHFYSAPWRATVLSVDRMSFRWNSTKSLRAVNEDFIKRKAKEARSSQHYEENFEGGLNLSVKFYIAWWMKPGHAEVSPVSLTYVFTASVLERCPYWKHLIIRLSITVSLI